MCGFNLNCKLNCIHLQFISENEKIAACFNLQEITHTTRKQQQQNQQQSSRL